MRLSTIKMVFCSWVFCSYKEGVAIIPPSPSVSIDTLVGGGEHSCSLSYTSLAGDLPGYP